LGEEYEAMAELERLQAEHDMIEARIKELHARLDEIDEEMTAILKKQEAKP